MMQVHIVIILLMKLTKKIVRLDWNINDANKLSVRYNHTKTKDGVQLMVTQQMLVSVTDGSYIAKFHFL
jgi:hypothetical protein